MESQLVCRICGETKNIEKHYGSLSCYGCKAFFRRTILEKRVYLCKDNGSCEIDQSTRNKCRSCRFEKCKQSGMNIESIREPHSKNQVNSLPSNPLPEISDIKTDNSSAANLLNFLHSMNRICYDNFDPDLEFISAEKVVELYKKCGKTITLEEGLQRPEMVAVRTRMKWTYERVYRPEDFTFMYYRFFVFIADFANMIPQFRQLCLKDQCTLFRLNFCPMYWIIYLDAFLDKNTNFEIGYPSGNGSYMPVNDESITNPPWFMPSKKMAEEIFTLCDKLMTEFKKLDVDEKELCLLKAILLFQFEQVLSESGMVICEKMNENLIEALWYYQTVRYPQKTFEEQMKRHSKILLMIGKINQAWHIESDYHLLATTFDEITIEGIPKELLFYNTAKK